MPAVDLNRIYKVRSQERRPILDNPRMIPDAAGAFIGASVPGIRARLADADARAREKQGNLRARMAAIGELVGVGRQVGLAYAGAVERRDEADLNALQAAWQNHMNEGAPEAFRRQYVRGGENGEGADGPARAIRELDAKFDESDSFGNARASVKERFAQWRARARQSYYGRGDERQANAADEFQKQMTIARYAAEDDNIASLRGLDQDERWRDAVAKTLDERMGEVWKKFPEVAAANPKWMESTRRDLEEKYNLDRLKEWTASLAATQDRELDANLLAAAEAYANGTSAFQLSAAGREEAAKFVEAAKRTHESNVARAQDEEARGIAGEIATLTYGINPETHEKFDHATRASGIANARERAWKIEDPATRSKLLTEIDETEANLDYRDFMGDFLETAGPMEDPSELFVSGNEDSFDALMQRAEGIENEVARAKAVEFLMTGRAKMSDLEERRAMELAKAEGIAIKEAQERTKNAALTAIILGFEEVRDKDGNKARRELTPEMKAERFRSVFPALSPSEVEKYSAKIVAAANDATVTERDIDLVGAAAGIDKLSGLFSENATGVLVLDKTKANKNGTYDVNPPGWRDEFEMPVDALLDMVESIRQYKAAVAVAGPSGIRSPEEVLASILADKSAFRGYCADAQRRANAAALKEYRRAIGRAFIEETKEEGPDQQ